MISGMFASQSSNFQIRFTHTRHGAVKVTDCFVTRFYDYNSPTCLAARKRRVRLVRLNLNGLREHIFVRILLM